MSLRAATAHVPGRLEIAAMVLLIAFYSEALMVFIVASEGDDTPLARLVWLPFYVGILGLAAAGWRNTWRAVSATPLILLLVVFVFASVAWSINPPVTLRRAIALLMTTLLGWSLAARYGWLWMLRLLGLAWLTVSLGSFLVGLLMPAIGRMDEVHVGAWQGLFFHKNKLGGEMARSSLLFGVLALGDRDWRRLWLSAFGLAVLLVILSTSKTALLGVLLGVGVLALGLLVRHSARATLLSIWLGGTAMTLLTMALLFVPNAVFGLLGRDATLTGRTDIWAAIGEALAERPWLGYGYGVFWRSESEPGNTLREKVAWEAPSAHNGWLEICLAIGPVALGIFILSYGASVARGLSGLRHNWGHLFAIGFLAQYTLFSVSESIILKQNSLLWATYVAVAAKLAMGLTSQARFRPPAAVLMRSRAAGREARRT
jgi:exopolysaccharide production protein ExoQ